MTDIPASDSSLTTLPITALPLHDVLKGMGLVLFAVAVWSGWIIVSRVGVTGALTAYDITAIRFGTAGAILLPVLWRKGFRIGPWGVAGGILIACLMGALYNTLAVYGMAFAPASHASALINASMLMASYAFGYLMLKEPVGRLQISGIACCLGGIALILIARRTGSDDPRMLLGHALFMLAGGMWGAYAAFNRKWRLDPLHATAAICGYSFLFYLPPYLLWLPKGIMTAPVATVTFQAFYQGVLNSVLALLCYNKGIAILGATRASAFVPLVPVVSTLLAIPLLGEIPGPLEWLGVGLVALGVLLACGILRILQARLRR